MNEIPLTESLAKAGYSIWAGMRTALVLSGQMEQTPIPPPFDDAEGPDRQVFIQLATDYLNMDGKLPYNGFIPVDASLYPFALAMMEGMRIWMESTGMVDTTTPL